MPTTLSDAGVNLPDHYEVVDGVVRELPPMGVRESILANMVLRLLDAWCTSRKAGLAVSEVLFQLDAEGNLQRKPDVAFLSKRQLAGMTEVPDVPAWPISPTLAVEVVSPTNTMNEIVDKICDYFAHGVERVWIVLPKRKLVQVYDGPSSVRSLTTGEILKDDVILPGLEIPLDDLFLDPLRKNHE